MYQASIVALPAAKNHVLDNFIKECDRFIEESSLGVHFKALDAFHVHGTIIGLEKTYDPGHFYNVNMVEQCSLKRPMDFDRAITLIRECLPLTIRFGGFSPSYKSFTSWCELPYVRSFQLFSRGPDATIVGWPHDNGDFSDKILWRIREALEKKCNIRHKYANEMDNGFFMNLGKFSVNISENDQISDKTLTGMTDLLETVRDYFFHNPFDITLDRDNVKIVQYRNMAQGGIIITDDLSLADIALSAESVQGLYEEAN